MGADAEDVVDLIGLIDAAGVRALRLRGQEPGTQAAPGGIVAAANGVASMAFPISLGTHLARTEATRGRDLAAPAQARR